ncbi:MAG: putative PilT domain containing protein [Candidatus Saccharibacteria bacterium]|nr:putative PilT domain containing protein [Candidatus Saccharibacteria bacterium]
MNTEQLLIVTVLLVLLGEVTYLVAKLPRATSTSKKRLIFIDTSVLIDGRILPVAASGFIGDTLAIPRSVIGELQFLADNADAEKRSRARHGLDVARELQELAGIDVQLFQDGSKAEEGVDERLLNLAKKHGGAICTIDYNLNKVAVVEGITVCNVNELAKNLRMAYLPGEKMMLELVQKGQDSHQAVGHLQDGTMVVVEHASGQIGQTIEIEFIRSLQTAAGKMMFAKKVESAVRPVPQQKPNKQKPTGTKPAPRPINKPDNNPNNPHNQPNNNRRPKQRRSSDRENDLINLVEKQQ